METITEKPYWLYGGSEICSHCGQPYVYEMEYRCAECDQGICPICAFTDEEGSECFCPDCCPNPSEE